MSNPTMKFILLTCSLLLFLAFTTEGRSKRKFDTEKKDYADYPLPPPIPGLHVLNRTMRATEDKTASKFVRSSSMVCSQHLDARCVRKIKRNCKRMNRGMKNDGCGFQR